MGAIELHVAASDASVAARAMQERVALLGAARAPADASSAPADASAAAQWKELCIS